MHLLINSNNSTLQDLYNHHEHYHKGDSGFDLYCPCTITIEPGEFKKIDLGIRCEAFKDNNKNTSYYLYPRSSIVKTSLRMANSVGIIDAGYRGYIMACVDNISDEPCRVLAGTRLFQICASDLSPLSVKLVNILSETTRGEGGFGSTNVYAEPEAEQSSFTMPSPFTERILEID